MQKNIKEQDTNLCSAVSTMIVVAIIIFITARTNQIPLTSENTGPSVNHWIGMMELTKPVTELFFGSPYILIGKESNKNMAHNDDKPGGKSSSRSFVRKPLVWIMG